MFFNASITYASAWEAPKRDCFEFRTRWRIRVKNALCQAEKMSHLGWVMPDLGMSSLSATSAAETRGKLCAWRDSGLGTHLTGRGESCFVFFFCLGEPSPGDLYRRSFLDNRSTWLLATLFFLHAHALFVKFFAV